MPILSLKDAAASGQEGLRPPWTVGFARFFTLQPASLIICRRPERCNPAQLHAVALMAMYGPGYRQCNASSRQLLQSLV